MDSHMVLHGERAVLEGRRAAEVPWTGLLKDWRAKLPDFSSNTALVNASEYINKKVRSCQRDKNPT